MFHKTVVIIPCRNVEGYCEAVINNATKSCSHVVCVNDGSTDNTAQILRKIAKKDSSHIHIITFPKNLGKGFALLAGMDYAEKHFNYDSLVTIDSDGQHCPSFIPELIQPIFDGVDFVIGERPFQKMPKRSRFGNTWISWLLKMQYGFAPKDTQSGMRALSPKIVKEFIQSLKGGRYETEFRCLLTALSKNFKVASITIPTIYLDENKSSHFSPLKDALRILKVFFGHLVGL